jgi:hypothetical protein
MGAGASLANEVLMLDDNIKSKTKVPTLGPGGVLTQAELLRTIQRKSFTSALHSGRKLSINRRRFSQAKYELPAAVTELMKKVGIEHESVSSPTAVSSSAQSPRPQGGGAAQNDQTSKMVAHIFECLGALQHLVRANQYGLENNESEETQSVTDRNLISVGKLIHEMVSIYGLAGDTLRILLNTSPNAASVEDEFGRRPIHVAVDRDTPWVGLVEDLIKASPQSLRSRDGGGRLPLHVAVDRDIPNANVVELLLQSYPDAASARRGVGRLPIHYAVFRYLLFIAQKKNASNELEFYDKSDTPSVEVVNKLIHSYPDGVSLPDLYGRLAIHYAVDRCKPNIKCVKALVNAFPDCKCSDIISNILLLIFFYSIKGSR